MPYYPPPSTSTGGIVPEVTVDPSSPLAGYSWILDTGAVGAAGVAMGPLGMTYARREVNQYQFCLKMSNGDIKRTVMS